MRANSYNSYLTWYGLYISELRCTVFSWYLSFRDLSHAFRDLSHAFINALEGTIIYMTYKQLLTMYDPRGVIRHSYLSCRTQLLTYIWCVGQYHTTRNLLGTLHIFSTTDIGPSGYSYLTCGALSQLYFSSRLFMAESKLLRNLYFSRSSSARLYWRRQ